eukprot:gene16593-biopygen21811
MSPRLRSARTPPRPSRRATNGSRRTRCITSSEGFQKIFPVADVLPESLSKRLLFRAHMKCFVVGVETTKKLFPNNLDFESIPIETDGNAESCFPEGIIPNGATPLPSFGDSSLCEGVVDPPQSVVWDDGGPTSLPIGCSVLLSSVLFCSVL